MKKLVFLLVVIGILGCDDKVSPNAKLIGRWNWIQTSGGLAGIIETPASTGKTAFIEISSTSIKRYENGVLLGERNYSIDKGQSIYSNEDTFIINYDNDWKQSFVIQGDTLILRDECFDCHQTEYVKISSQE